MTFYPKDLTGRIFGQWTVLHRHPERLQPKRAHWRCRCACGTEGLVRTDKLTGGRSTRCPECVRHKRWLILPLSGVTVVEPDVPRETSSKEGGDRLARPLHPIPDTIPPARAAFVRALKERRKKGAVKDAAERCGLSWGAMNRFFTGKSVPSQKVAQDMAAACEVPWFTLMPLWHAAHIEVETWRLGHADPHFVPVPAVSLEVAVSLLQFQVETQKHRIEQLEEAVEALTTTRKIT